MANGGQPMNDRELLLDTHKEVKFLKKFVEEHFSAGEKRMDSIEGKVVVLESFKSDQPVKCAVHDARITAMEKVCKKVPTTGKIVGIVISSLTLMTILFVWYQKVSG